MAIGFSRLSLIAFSNSAPNAPSMTRWSTDRVTDMTVATASSPSLPTTGFLTAGTDRKDRAVGRVDHRVKVVDAEHAQVRDGKAAALVFMRRKFAVAGAGGEVFHLG